MPIEEPLVGTVAVTFPTVATVLVDVKAQVALAVCALPLLAKASINININAGNNALMFFILFAEKI